MESNNFPSNNSDPSRPPPTIVNNNCTDFTITHNYYYFTPPSPRFLHHVVRREDAYARSFRFHTDLYSSSSSRPNTSPGHRRAGSRPGGHANARVRESSRDSNDISKGNESADADSEEGARNIQEGEIQATSGTDEDDVNFGEDAGEDEAGVVDASEDELSEASEADEAAVVDGSEDEVSEASEADEAAVVDGSEDELSEASEADEAGVVDGSEDELSEASEADEAGVVDGSEDEVSEASGEDEAGVVDGSEDELSEASGADGYDGKSIETGSSTSSSDKEINEMIRRINVGKAPADRIKPWWNRHVAQAHGKERSKRSPRSFSFDHASSESDASEGTTRHKPGVEIRNNRTLRRPNTDEDGDVGPGPAKTKRVRRTD